MNYFAHSYHHLDAPYFAAGTAVPDWLSVCGPRRLRRKHVEVVLARLGTDPENGVAAEGLEAGDALVLEGILRHFDDDVRFHADAVFLKVASELTLSIRHRHPDRPRLRASFLGHVLTELLLDACLIEADPGRLDLYYESLESVDAEHVQRAVNRCLPGATRQLAACMRRFVDHRFLEDYLDDEGLVFRLGQVVRRVGLPDLPETFPALLPAWRERVRGSVGELIPATG